MGEVFSAVHPKIGKRAAIKVLKQELSNPYNVERFIDEAKVVNTIGHPNIVDIFAFGEMPDGRCYFVMELLVGETLRERIARGPMTPEEVSSILRPLTRALEAAHAKGVTHRDLKPDNIFLVEVAGEKPTVKLLDFGIAKLAKADHRVEQTKSGVMVGTPQYIAPEQAKGREIDFRADIYALGGITFEMLTGRPPFEADNAMEMVAKHLMEAPVRPSSLVATIPRELDSIVIAMLEKDPAQRPALADIMMVLERLKAGAINLDDLETLNEAHPPHVQDPPRRLPTPHPVAPVFTPVTVSGSAGFPYEPLSGAHTSVELIVEPLTVIEPTERDALELRKSRGLWIAISVIVLGIAMILSFILIKVLKSSETKPGPDAAVVATTQDAAKHSGTSVTPIVEPDAAVVLERDAAVVEPDAAPSDAAIVRDAGVAVRVVPERPKPRARLVLDLQNAHPSKTEIRINGQRVGGGLHLERELVLDQFVTIDVISEGRRPKRFRVRPTTQRPVVNLKFELDLDVMEPK